MHDAGFAVFSGAGHGVALGEEHAVCSVKVDACVEDALVEFGGGEFADGAFGAGVAGFGGGSGADGRQAEYFGFDPELGDGVLPDGVFDRVEAVLALLPGVDEAADGSFAFGHGAAAEGDAFVHEGGEGDFPAFAFVSEHVRVWDRDVGEEHFVEFGFTGDLVEGFDFDAGGVHVDDEVGHALVLRCVGLVRTNKTSQRFGSRQRCRL